MTVHRLDERAGPLETHCFVCSPTNEYGLRIPFSYDDETGEVCAEFTFDRRHSGAPTYVHGGLSLAVLNEAMAWAVVATTRGFAITEETTAHFRQPLRIGLRYEVRSVVTEPGTDRLATAGRIVDDAGRTCVEASAGFRVLSAAIADRLRARVGGAQTSRR